jgi:acetyl-CoA carboxylase carboxyltransferase component
MWPSAEVNFMDPRHAVTIVHGVKQDDDPVRYAELLAQMSQDTSAYEMASAYNGHIVILPEETRDTLGRLLDGLALRLTGGVGEHLMRTWPTSY